MVKHRISLSDVQEIYMHFDNICLFYLTGLPLDQKFPRFKHEEDGNTDGFSPAKPKPLMPLKLLQ